MEEISGSKCRRESDNGRHSLHSGRHDIHQAALLNPHFVHGRVALVGKFPATTVAT